MRLLSPVEQSYLSGTRQFTKSQQRYIRYRLKKKLRLLDESRDAAAALLLRLEEETSSCERKAEDFKGRGRRTLQQRDREISLSGNNASTCGVDAGGSSTMKRVAICAFVALYQEDTADYYNNNMIFLHHHRR